MYVYEIVSNKLCDEAPSIFQCWIRLWFQTSEIKLKQTINDF